MWEFWVLGVWLWCVVQVSAGVGLRVAAKPRSASVPEMLHPRSEALKPWF